MTGFLLAALLPHAQVVGAANFLDVRPADRASITVDPDVVIRDELPATLFGFNIHHHIFQDDLWRPAEQAADPKIVESLRFFPGALYRYPGGLIANNFWWEEAVGPARDRGIQKAVKWSPARQVLFGVEEYIDFVTSVGGHPWYVLNLVGWDTESLHLELPAKTMVESNAELARFMLSRLGKLGMPRYYQLGNELDRAGYEWSHEKYIDRAKSTMAAVHAVDPDARFVAFLRDYDWIYKKAPRKGEISGYEQLISDVLEGLPAVEDFSLQYYYDDPGLPKKYKQLSWRLQQFQRAIQTASRERGGKPLNVWITEHARGVNLPAGKPMHRARFTSNLAAAISTSDFLIALAQIPEIQGAAWHGLNAGPWQLFDASIRHNDLRPRPVYWGMRVLREMRLPVVLGTSTASPNLSKYAGGYDIRAAGFTDEEGGALGLWAVNRAPRPAAVELNFAPYRGASVVVRHFHVSGEAGVDADAPELSPTIELEPSVSNENFSQSGAIQIELPPSSISTFIFTRAGPD